MSDTANLSENICLLNGQLSGENTQNFSHAYRAMAFGDGLFETMRATRGHIWQLRAHSARLSAGCAALGLNNPLTHETLLQAWKVLASVLNPHSGYRLRLNVWRAGQGAYAPETDAANWLLMAKPLPRFELPVRPGVQVGVLREPLLAMGPFSTHKTLNALPYVLAARAARANGWGDALMLNTDGRIAEATSSNLFYQREGRWFTPPLGEGCIAGISRKVLLEQVRLPDFEPQTRPLLQAELPSVQQMFLTNFIRGVVPVHGVADISWETSPTDLPEQLTHALNSTDPPIV
ncbi:MAG: aminotransferase class IV [Bacteroidota bacterium]